MPRLSANKKRLQERAALMRGTKRQQGSVATATASTAADTSASAPPPLDEEEGEEVGEGEGEEEDEGERGRLQIRSGRRQGRALRRVVARG